MATAADLHTDHGRAHHLQHLRHATRDSPGGPTIGQYSRIGNINGRWAAASRAVTGSNRVVVNVMLAYAHRAASETSD